MSKFEPNQIISLQISYLSEATVEKSEFCVLIKHCFLMGKNTVLTKQWLDKCHLDFAPSETTIKRWYADFKRNRTDANDAERSDHPNSAVVLENTQNLHKLILADLKLKLREIAEELKISEGSAFTILHEHLSMRKLCSNWVQCLLTVDQKQHIDDSEHCLQLFQHNKKEFLYKCDNGWNMDPPLHSGFKLAVSWVDSNSWNLSKVTKDANIIR